MADEVLPFSGDRGEGTPVARGGNGIWGAGGRAAGPAGGEDLGALLRHRGRLPAGRTAVLVSQVAMALDAAHDAGLVHGSVTPASIVVGPGESGRAVLTDASVARPGLEPLDRPASIGHHRVAVRRASPQTAHAPR